MNYLEGVGSKKGGGGIASESQFNLQRRKEVESLLSKGENVPYTFQDEKDDQVRSNPYIYKNHSGKLVCKLCNTMHMSWSSVERHLGGKKQWFKCVKAWYQYREKFSRERRPNNS
ncbi:Prp11p [Saccharomyces cerevisiae Vin13]|nr:Prp11p [Saccharomyces cerevisiae Vin13]